MKCGQLGTVVRYVRRVAGPATNEPTDGQLLRRFVEQRDDGAFALLVERHGAMVLGVSQRVLHDANDAEDVFQATFLVLVRKAASIRKRESLASWLHGVARRTALKVRRSASCRQTQSLSEDMLTTCSEREIAQNEMRPLLDEELQRLPEKYRMPLILCYLEGKTNVQAAEELGCTKGTVSGRLARARDLLRRRLVRRGLSVTPAILVGFLCEQSSASTVSAPLLVSTTNLASQSLGGAIGAAATETKAITLAEGVVRSMWLIKAKTIVGMFLAVMAVGTGVGVWGFSSVGGRPGFALVGSESGANVTPATDEELLQGSWLAVSAVMDAGPAPELAGTLSYGFDGKKIIIARNGISANGSYKLNSKSQPKHIDILLAGNKRPIKGIYTVDADRLKLCIEEKPKSRPTTFKTGRGSNHLLVSFQRADAGKNKNKGGRRAEIRRLRDENAKLRAELKKAQDELRRMLYRLDIQRAQQELQAAEKAKLDQLLERKKRDKDILRRLEQLRLNEAQDRLLQLQKEKARIQELEAQRQLNRAQQLLQEQRRAFEAEKQAIKARQFANDVRGRAQSAANLRKIGLAFHNYHDIYNRLPASAIHDKNGVPVLSWRVALLPFLGQQKLYSQFKLDQAWNSPHNKKLLNKMPDVYRPFHPEKRVDQMTNYQVFTGAGTMFERSQVLTLGQLTAKDGCSNTAMVVEAARFVPWTKPEDLRYDAKSAPAKLSGSEFKGFHVLAADGAVHYFRASPAAETMRRLILIDDRKPVSFEQFQKSAK